MSNLMDIAKHLPGKHNQKLHAGSRGGGGSSGSASSSSAPGMSTYNKALQKLGSDFKPSGPEKGMATKRITNQKDGRYVDVSVSNSDREGFINVYAEMRNSDNTKVTGNGGEFFWPTGVEAIQELTGSGKFPSVAAVKRFGGF